MLVSAVIAARVKTKKKKKTVRSSEIVPERPSSINDFGYKKNYGNDK